MSKAPFKMEVEELTPEIVRTAADRIEMELGQIYNGDRAPSRLNLYSLAVLIEHARRTATPDSKPHLTGLQVHVLYHQAHRGGTTVSGDFLMQLEAMGITHSYEKPE